MSRVVCCPTARAAARGQIKQRSIIAMSRRHRHVRASRGEWIHVHRRNQDRRPSPDPPWWLWVIGGLLAIALIEVVLEILAAVLPWLLGIAIVVAVIWVVVSVIRHGS